MRIAIISVLLFLASLNLAAQADSTVPRLSDYRGWLEELEKDTYVFKTAVEAFRYGRYMWVSGNYTAARQDYNKAIELNPEYGLLYYNRGNAKFKIADNFL
ncbi:MAG: tetratricopeptide repeat protein [Crocinitomicaceae bacterium]|nr:tetratricopeptide repeat protein [Crocinitomicaceae bacterium]MDG1657755.1 tetratricopeptide repeat protein [Crocinitomicaceae bacterium]MDG2441140.1 tetratricopeptide repeat protein [Crocinitomicaceae bacterium]